MRTELLQASEEVEVISWRCDELVASGFPLTVAAGLARDSDYDLHALIELAEAGCPLELAVRIQAPLDKGTAA